MTKITPIYSSVARAQVRGRLEHQNYSASETQAPTQNKKKRIGRQTTKRQRDESLNELPKADDYSHPPQRSQLSNLFKKNIFTHSRDHRITSANASQFGTQFSSTPSASSLDKKIAFGSGNVLDKSETERTEQSAFELKQNFTLEGTFY